MTETIEKTVVSEETYVEPPHQWNVVMYNDDITPFMFVVAILVQNFSYTKKRAFSIAKEINDGGATGKAIIATYPKSIAEQKVEEVVQIARMAGFPLRVEAERSDI